MNLSFHQSSKPIISVVIAIFMPISAQAAITAVNQGNFGGSAPGATESASISVGAGADMLVVMTSTELGALSGDAMSVTYGGVGMTLATGNLSLTGIWYIDLTTPGISGTDIVVDMTDYGTRNGFAAGWVTLDGNLSAGESIALHAVNNSANTESSVSLTTTVDDTFNVMTFNANGGTQITSIFADSDLAGVDVDGDDIIYANGDIGSARGAATWDLQATAGSNSYSWTINNPDNGSTVDGNYRRIDAAAFTVIPEPSSVFLIAMSGLLLLRRRRC